ncbi:MAG: hypothetical protein NBV67_07840 [Tagaea sp.]|nr:hypothetical protein [Tagaea sp.]
MIETARETAPSTRTLPSGDATSTEKEGAALAKSGTTQTRTQGATTVNSGSDNARPPMVFGRRATYFDNPRLALFAPPRWPGGGGGRSARRSAKS